MNMSAKPDNLNTSSEHVNKKAISEHEALIERLNAGCRDHAKCRIDTCCCPVMDDAAQAIADLQAENEKLREVLAAIEVLDYPRPLGTQYMADRESKHDKCTHGIVMYEECGNCVSDYARAALKGGSDE